MIGSRRPSSRWLLACVAMPTALISSPRVASAQIPDCIHFEDYIHTVGRAEEPAESRGIAVEGATLYIAAGYSGFAIMDASDPAALRLLGSVDTPGQAFDVEVARGHAFIADSWAGLQVIAVTDPESPRIVGGLDTPGSAFALTVLGTRAYVAAGAGLHIIEIADPTAPRLLGTADTPGSCQSVAVSDNLAYVADRSGGLHVIDVSDPTVPFIAYTMDEFDPWAVFLSGTLLGVGETGSVTILDVSAPGPPQVAGSVRVLGYPSRLAATGSLFYVAGIGLGLQVIDATDPHDPRDIGRVDAQGSFDTAVNPPWAYLSGLGIQVIDITNPRRPPILGGLDESASDIVVRRNLAYVGGPLRVVDVSDPRAPFVIGSAGTGGGDLEVIGTRVCTAEAENGAAVYDASNPAHPILMARRHTPSFAQGVAVAGDIMFVADHTAGLLVMDISNLPSIGLVGSLDTPGFARKVALSGDLAYVMDYEAGILIADISTPETPVPVSTLDTPGQAEHIVLAGTLGYIADGEAGLQVADFSDVTAPRLAGGIDTPGYASRVEIAGSHAYVTEGRYGLGVYDVTDPTSPLRIGEVDAPAGQWQSTSPEALAVAVNFGVLYVGEINGFYTLPLQCEPTTSVAQDGPRDEMRPGEPRLIGVHPNPVLPSRSAACVRFDLAASAQVRLAIYDAAGRTVRVLASGTLEAGTHSTFWSGRDEQGRAAPAGVYLLDFRAGAVEEVRTLVVVK